MTLFSSDVGVTDISCGDAHNLALVTMGNIFSWGDNSAGQLGTPHTYTDITKPRQIAIAATSGVISQVACGANFSAALASESDWRAVEWAWFRGLCSWVWLKPGS